MKFLDCKTIRIFLTKQRKPPRISPWRFSFCYESVVQLDEVAFHLDASDVLLRENELTPRQAFEAARLFDLVLRKRERLVLNRLFGVGRRSNLFFLLDESRQMNSVVLFVELHAFGDNLVGILPISLVLSRMDIARAHAIRNGFVKRLEHESFRLGFQIVFRLVGFQSSLVVLASSLVVDTEVKSVARSLAVFFGNVEKGYERASLLCCFLQNFQR